MLNKALEAVEIVSAELNKNKQILLPPADGGATEKEA
jgi:hypothetical protein